MKSILMNIVPQNTVNLPFAHFRILQGLVYHLLSYDSAISETVHNKKEGKADSFKMFCFSDLCGRYRIDSQSLIYEGPVSFEIRSAEDSFIDVIAGRLDEDSLLSINQCACKVIDYSVSSRFFLNNEAVFTMNTPIVAYHTIDKHTVFYGPSDENFFPIVCNNLLKKYEMLHDASYTGPLGIECVECRPKDKCVTSFKGTYLTGYYGAYRLVASGEMLRTAYFCGLGGKNSMGFGVGIIR